MRVGLIFFGAVFLVLACDSGPEDKPDAGINDGGFPLEGTVDVSLSSGWQRGAIPLNISVEGDPQLFAAGEVSWSVDGENFFEATGLEGFAWLVGFSAEEFELVAPEESGEELGDESSDVRRATKTWVWDSWQDLSDYQGLVELRVVFPREGGYPMDTIEIDLHNVLDRVRPIVVGRAYEPQLSLHRLDLEGTIVLDQELMDQPFFPGQMFFMHEGKYAVVQENAGANIQILTFDPMGNFVEAGEVFSVPEATNLRSHLVLDDEHTAYLCNFDAGENGGLIPLTIDDGRPVFGSLISISVPAAVQWQAPATGFDSGQLIVSGGGNPIGVTVMDAQGTILDSLDLGTSLLGTSLAWVGSNKLVYPAPWDASVFLLDIEEGAVSRMQTLEFPNPANVLKITGNKVLVAQLDMDKLSLVSLESDTLQVSQEITGVELADVMTMVHRGIFGRTVLVSEVVSFCALDFDDETQTYSLGQRVVLGDGSGAEDIIRWVATH